jgi:hypothetical protein
MTVEDSRALGSGIADPIRMRNLGWDKLKFNRPSYLVSLEFEASIGLGTPMGLRVYDRVLMGTKPDPEFKER